MAYSCGHQRFIQPAHIESWLVAGILYVLLMIYPKLQALQLTAWAWAGMMMYSGLATSLGKRTALMLTAGFAYYVYWFYTFPNHRYTNDLKHHIDYIDFIRETPLYMYSYMGNESWHPPFYYMVAALWTYITELQFGNYPRSSLRILALAMYMVYCLYSVLTLRLVHRKEDMPYWVGCALIIFWPLSILMATRITNDVMMYMVWGMFYYYYLRWYKEGSLKLLALSVMLVGVGCMVKTNAAVLAAILGITALGFLYRGRLRFGEVFSFQMLPAYLFLLAGMLFNQSKGIYLYLHNEQWLTQLGKKGSANNTVNKVLSFDVTHYLDHPYLGKELWHQPNQTGYFLKTLLHGEFNWHQEPIASVMNGLLLVLLTAVIIYAAYAVLKHSMQDHIVFPHLLAVLTSYLAVVGFFLSQRNAACSDARFVYPLVVPLILLFIQSLGLWKEKLPMLYWPLLATGLLLPVLGVIHYLLYKG